MMEVKEFIEKMKDEVKLHLPEDVRGNIIIDDVTVVKMNDQKLHGLTFKTPGSDAAPTLYVDEMFSAYRDGADLRYLASEMAGMYVESRNVPMPPEVDLSYDNVKDKLTVRLLERNRNREFLANTPHVNVGNGLAIMSDINMGETGNGEWRIAVNNNVLESLKIDKETLFADAMKSSTIVEPPTLMDMTNALFSPERNNLLDRNEPLEPHEVGGMYVLTNTSGSLGASVLYYPDVKEKAAELLGSGYYILPSSIHEVILVPDNSDIKENELCDMVKQANRTVVDEKEVLSDNVYHYSKDEMKLEKVTPDRELADRVAEGR